MPEALLPVGLREVAIIAAMTRERVIGREDQLPWSLPEDLQHFRSLTVGNTIIMGRKTYESIGHPLPDRQNIVLSRTLEQLPGARICRNFTDSLLLASRFRRPVFVVGGAELYRKALPIARVLHISWVKHAHAGNVYFPEFDLADWSVSEELDNPDFRYVQYLRRNPFENHAG